METKQIGLLREVASYYSEKITQHGQTPFGVDWNGEESQFLRFEQLSKIFDVNLKSFSLNDLGCGYGALFEFLRGKYSMTSYLGVDVSKKMVFAAQSRNIAYPEARFITAAKPDAVADYSVASGIFNVRQSRTDNEWYDYIKATLEVINQSSRLGFAFNCLTSYSDEDKKQDNLYYADPCQLFDLCKRFYSRQVALLHDYGLYEFTILVKKR